jgi:hypothetical protein
MPTISPLRPIMAALNTTSFPVPTDTWGHDVATMFRAFRAKRPVRTVQRDQLTTMSAEGHSQLFLEVPRRQDRGRTASGFCSHAINHPDSCSGASKPDTLTSLHRVPTITLRGGKSEVLLTTISSAPQSQALEPSRWRKSNCRYAHREKRFNVRRFR